MKKFILFNSPIFWNSLNEREQYLSPLGLGYIATYLERANIDVELYDCVKKKKSAKEVIEYINYSKPNYIGMNVFTQNYDIVKYIIENINTPCECFIGGQVVKYIYKDLLSWESNNIINIIIGEGELIIPSIVQQTCKEEPIIIEEHKKVYRVDSCSTYFPQDISGLLLDRKFLHNEIITNHYGDKEGSIITSRGCIYDCAFCGGAKSLNSDISVRVRNEESIIQEIRSLVSLYPNLKSIRILDDLFLRNRSSIDMAYRIFSEFPDLKWRGMVHTTSLINSLDKMELLLNSNCRELFLGIESGSNRVRKRINKLGTTEEIIQVAMTILNEGIDLKGYFIYGFPQETEDDFKETYGLAERLKEISKKTKGNFRTSVFQFRPYQGTKLYNQIIENGGIIHKCETNRDISCFEGRTQFNFDFGNYSLTSNDILNQYIIKTQEM